MAVEVIELTDNVTAPARKAASALRALDKAMTGVKKAFEGAASLSALAGVFDTIGASGGRAKQQLRELDDQLKRLKADSAKPVSINVHSSNGAGGSVLGGLGGEGGGGIGALGAIGGIGLAVGVVTKSLDAAKRIFEEIVHLAGELSILAAKTAIEESNFKSSTLASFERLSGSRREAEKLYENVKGISRLTGEAPENIVSRMQKLIGDGFSPKAADKILRAVADVGAARGEAAGERLATIIDTVKNKGALDKGAIRQLAKIGVDTETVYKVLAEKTHKSLDQVKADLKAGRIEADVASAAIAKAAEQKFGGAAQSKADNDIFILLARAKLGIKELFADVDIGPVRGALQNAVKFLEGKGGSALKGAIGGTVGQLLHTLFDPFNGPGGAEKLENMGRAVIQILGWITAALKAAAPVVSFFASVLASLGAQDKGTSGLDKLIASLKAGYQIFKLFTGLGSMDGVTKSLAELFGDGKGKKNGASPTVDKGLLGGVTSAIGGDALGADAAAGQPAAFQPVGNGMTNGLIAGIEGGKSGVVASIVSVTSAAVAAANAALEIHSPSRVFARIGAFTAQGFAAGVDGDTSPARAAAGMAGGAAAAAVSAPSRGDGAPAASGGHTFNVTLPSVHVQANDAAGGAAAGAAVAGPLADAIRDGITRAVREMREAG